MCLGCLSVIRGDSRLLQQTSRGAVFKNDMLFSTRINVNDEASAVVTPVSQNHHSDGLQSMFLGGMKRMVHTS